MTVNSVVSSLEEATPGGVLLKSGGQPAPFGRLTAGGAAVTADVRYDLASLTKVVATLPAVLQLVSSGELELDRPLRHWFSNAGWFQQPSLADSTVRQLLAHNSGLPNWVPLFTETRDRLLALGRVLQSPVRDQGGPAVYSDLGFMLLGALVERVTGQRLDRYVEEHVFRPLGMEGTGFPGLAGGAVSSRALNIVYAPTEYCGWRNRLLVGEVHDENACAWEGVAGHAGLFGTAADLGKYAQAWLDSDPRLGSPELLQEALKQQSVTVTGEPRGLGWSLAHPGSFAGDIPGYGHTGFTGTSIWIDPTAGQFTVLLTNRVNPDRHARTGISELRLAVHAPNHERKPR